ncbi:hypothetical protein CBR61_14455 [Porphyrobacter sp. CACIAM 03H1]|nr:hypothetical protein CBR61_14455 [Porphyrobacter sp. CACIAM 03H1]
MLFVERLRRHRRDELGDAFRATLTELHNNGTIDVLEPAKNIASSPIDQHQFFTVMHIYSDLIPSLEAEVPTMLAAVKALTARAGDDGASGMPNGAFRTWAEQGDRAKAMLAAVDPAAPEDSAYVFIGLQALAKSDPTDALTRSLAYLEGPHAPSRSAAGKAIGTFALATSEARDTAVAALTAAAPTADDNSLGHILTAICEITRAHPEIAPQAASLINASIAQVGDQAIHQLSLELMFHGEELGPEIVESLTAIMHKVQMASQGTLTNIDAAASKLINHKRLDEALALVSPLIAAHDALTSMETLDGTSFALRQLPPGQLAQVVMGWLLSAERNLGAATLALAGDHHGGAPLIVDIGDTALALDDADRILLAHRAVGWLFIHSITAASLLLGLLKGASEVATHAILDILFDPLLINYSGELAECLTERAKTAAEPEQAAIANLLTRLEAYIEGLRKAGRIKELRPSERERLIEQHRHHRSMQEAHNAAEKKSVFLSIVSRSVLLYGNRSISYFKGPDGRTQRNEMKLQTFSHSIESPRLDILEPFDLDYTLRVFRAMRKAVP